MSAGKWTHVSRIFFYLLVALGYGCVVKQEPRALYAILLCVFSPRCCDYLMLAFKTQAAAMRAFLAVWMAVLAMPTEAPVEVEEQE